MKKMSKIRAEIWDKVADIRHRIDNMNYLRSLFAREYLPLVDNDTDKAMIFSRRLMAWMMIRKDIFVKE